MTSTATRTVVLLGVSILDNGAYTGGGPHVAAQVQAGLPRHRPRGHRARLRLAPHRPLRVGRFSPAVVHILPDGYGYDLVEGRPLLPHGDPIEAPGDDTVSVSRRTRERQTT